MYEWKSSDERYPQNKIFNEVYGAQSWSLGALAVPHPYLNIITLYTRNQYHLKRPFCISIQASDPYNDDKKYQLKKKILEEGGEELEKLDLDYSEFDASTIQLHRDENNKKDLTIFLHVIAKVGGIKEDTLSEMKTFLGVLPLKKEVYRNIKLSYNNNGISAFDANDINNYLAIAEELNSLHQEVKDLKSLLVSKDKELLMLKAALAEEKSKNITAAMSKVGFHSSQNDNSNELDKNIDLSAQNKAPV